MSLASSESFVSREELEEILEDYHRARWRAIAVWALIFSGIVTAVLWQTHRQSDKYRHDRSAQISTIVKAGHEECLRSFSSMTAILHTTISPDRIQRATADERKTIDTLFALADPKTNCPPKGGLTAQEKQQLRDATTGETPNGGA